MEVDINGRPPARWAVALLRCSVSWSWRGSPWRAGLPDGEGWSSGSWYPVPARAGRSTSIAMSARLRPALRGPIGVAGGWP